MIELELWDECKNCPDFEVTQDTQHLFALDGDDIWQHTITCKHFVICKILKAHLQKEVSNYGN